MRGVLIIIMHLGVNRGLGVCNIHDLPRIATSRPARVPRITNNEQQPPPPPAAAAAAAQQPTANGSQVELTQLITHFGRTLYQYHHQHHGDERLPKTVQNRLRRKRLNHQFDDADEKKKSKRISKKSKKNRLIFLDDEEEEQVRAKGNILRIPSHVSQTANDVTSAARMSRHKDTVAWRRPHLAHSDSPSDHGMSLHNNNNNHTTNGKQGCQLSIRLAPKNHRHAGSQYDDAVEDLEMEFVATHDVNHANHATHDMGPEEPCTCSEQALLSHKCPNTPTGAVPGCQSCSISSKTRHHKPLAVVVADKSRAGSSGRVLRSQTNQGPASNQVARTAKVSKTISSDKPSMQDDNTIFDVDGTGDTQSLASGKTEESQLTSSSASHTAASASATGRSRPRRVSQSPVSAASRYSQEELETSSSVDSNCRYKAPPQSIHVTPSVSPVSVPGPQELVVQAEAGESLDGSLSSLVDKEEHAKVDRIMDDAIALTNVMQRIKLSSATSMNDGDEQVAATGLSDSSIRNEKQRKSIGTVYKYAANTHDGICERLCKCPNMELELRRFEQNCQTANLGPYPLSDFQSIWQAVQGEDQELGTTEDDIESNGSFRLANKSVNKSDSREQRKAMYGRILPNALQVRFDVAGSGACY